MKLIRQIMLSVATLLAVHCALAANFSPRTVTGKVTSGKTSLAGVPVTDGFSVVTTDKKGNFSITLNGNARWVYVTTPAGYSPQHTDYLPQFYLPIDSVRNSGYNFSLTRNTLDDNHHVLYVQTDIQVVEERELGIYDKQVTDARRCLQPYAAQGYDVVGIDCGDLVGDHPELYPSSLKHYSGLQFPLYRVIGNHDMKYYGRSHETSTSRFESHWGPTRYSFNKGKVHYIVVDDVFYIGRDYFYMGYLDEATFSWLEQDLALVPHDATVVVAMHIPSRLKMPGTPFKYNGYEVSEHMVNYAALHRMLEPYNAHIISGHTHCNLTLQISPRLIEHNTAAACGTWWDLPMCQDGTPQGYSLYVVDGDSIKWYYKGANFDANYQFRAYPVGYDKAHPDKIVANVWNYDHQWRVEWLENGKVMGEMTRYAGQDPYVINLIGDRKHLRYSWICAEVNEHMFYCTPSSADAEITVRVTDRFGNVYSQSPQIP